MSVGGRVDFEMTLWLVCNPIGDWSQRTDWDRPSLRMAAIAVSAAAVIIVAWARSPSIGAPRQPARQDTGQKARVSAQPKLSANRDLVGIDSSGGTGKEHTRC